MSYVIIIIDCNFKKSFERSILLARGGGGGGGGGGEWATSLSERANNFLLSAVSDNLSKALLASVFIIFIQSSTKDIYQPWLLSF